MALICTCGAQLPDNARFCLHCGKPQREEDLRPMAEAQPAFVPPPPPPVSFGNPIAFRVALISASISALLTKIPIMNLGCCLWMTGAGFLAAVLYARRTGLMLSVSDGVRLGWITGLLTSAISLVLMVVSFALLRRDGGIRELVRRQLETAPARDESVRQVIDFLTSPAGFTIFLTVSSVFFFIVAVSLSVAGGALGAKVMEKE
jgi:hypothetical protein